ELWTAKQADLLDVEKKTAQSQNLLSRLKSHLRSAGLISHKERDQRALTEITIGGIDARHARYAEAEKQYHSALSMQTDQQSPLAVACYQALARAEQSRGNFASAERNYLR